MKTIVLFLALFAYFSGGSCDSCGPLTVFKECGTACPATCFNYQKPRVCIAVCVRGCFCIRGYVLLGNRCVHPSQCPKVESTDAVDDVNVLCGPNEHTTVARVVCNTCDGVCVPPPRGCMCKPNFLLNRLTGRCVLPKNCPNLSYIGPKGVCEPNELLVTCKSNCLPTCSRPNPKACATNKCSPGCICKPPLIKDDVTDRCVRRERCTELCGENSVRIPCASYCQRTCQNPNPIPCPNVCSSGCICKKGYIIDERYNRCILEEHCPLRG